jgi:hypothetical protein
MNAKSQRIWSEALDCEMDSADSRWLIADLDGDGTQEVAILPKLIYPERCANDSIFFVFSESGNLLFRRPCLIEGKYPGTDQSLTGYYLKPPYFLPSKASEAVVTVQNSSFPGRAHVRLWSSSGTMLGWYINAGYMVGRPVRLDGGGIAFLCVNNRKDCFGLVVLRADGSAGCAPPYEDPVYDLQEVERGNQENYLLFPVTDLCRAVGMPYGSAGEIALTPNGILRVKINETNEAGGSVYFYLDDALRVSHVQLADIFWTRRSLLVLEGKLPLIDQVLYEQGILDSVQYWIDSGWVSEAQLRVAEEPQ